MSRKGIWLPAVVCLVAACGTSHHGAPPFVAAVGKDRISQTELSAYTRYVAGFDALAYPDSAEAACARKWAGATCARVRTQALVRLIQERLVQQYAQSHHLRLTPDDQTQIELEMAQLGAGSAPTRRLFTDHAVDRRFMRAVLARQILVQKVQANVAGERAVRGFEVHIRKFTVPVPPGANRQTLYQQAVAMATGGPVPAGTQVRDQWVAPFRLPADIRLAVKGTHRGEYIGPFARSGSYILVQVVGSGVHRYAAPARRALQRAMFRIWLQHSATSRPIRCLDARGTLSPCPRSIMKSV